LARCAGAGTTSSTRNGEAGRLRYATVAAIVGRGSRRPGDGWRSGLVHGLVPALPAISGCLFKYLSVPVAVSPTRERSRVRFEYGELTRARFETESSRVSARVPDACFVFPDAAGRARVRRRDERLVTYASDGCMPR
jgi:hypothetical protein